MGRVAFEELAGMRIAGVETGVQFAERMHAHVASGARAFCFGRASKAFVAHSGERAIGLKPHNGGHATSLLFYCHKLSHRAPR